MGLDAVEILMQVEEVFDISIDDSAAVKLLTPRDLIEAIVSKVELADSAGCLTQRAFNLLRKALLRHLPLKRREIAPSIPLASLVPKEIRKELLKKLAAELGTGPLPELVRPPSLVTLLTIQSLAAAIAAGFIVHKFAPETAKTALLVIGLIAAVVTHVGAWMATTGASTEFPPLTATVGDLARWVLAHKQDLAVAVQPTPPAGRWTREQVAARVREIVVDQLDCADTYREDASFVDDLGLS